MLLFSEHSVHLVFLSLRIIQCNVFQHVSTASATAVCCVRRQYTVQLKPIYTNLTSVSETIRKQPLVKAQTALKNKIWRKTILPRVCIARTMPWQDVCPSVCLSVRHTTVLSLNGYTYPQSIFTIGYPTILVFPYQTGWQYSDGEPPTGGVDYKAGMKKSRFSTNISELMRDRAIVTKEGE